MPGNYNWRPNDRSALTLMRYNLEAKYWVKAVNSAQQRLPSGNYGADLGFIGACIQLPLLLIFMILVIPIILIREIFGFNIKLFMGDEPTGWVRKGTYESLDDFRARMRALDKKHDGRGRKRKKQWGDLTIEEQRIVQMVRAETAKAKAQARAK